MIGDKLNACAPVKDWHNPRNEQCTHNRIIFAPCTCKRPVHRKPYRVVRVKLRPQFIEGRMRARVELEIHPDGLLRLREIGRRRRYETNVGRIYWGCVWREAMAVAQAAKAKRKNRRHTRR
jgi:hypothetical protein